ncbi:uncharacterized protein EV420DRAFT_501113 [Desarmillaria tabescens]|uniref:Uncharacterized protein n=1 Tax=Armillaria tabescens TaxID=1929756 RepID=A0AA39KAE2_ARMTA|nr:uncharacterized protein EV420DRAFT_501113 [Desarmillaria tabescens]KAK0457536.1 hypothetical protein EV420DRAFT_501113 [Desarmillaria tabescens]
MLNSITSALLSRFMISLFLLPWRIPVVLTMLNQTQVGTRNKNTYTDARCIHPSPRINLQHCPCCVRVIIKFIHESRVTGKMKVSTDEECAGVYHAIDFVGGNDLSQLPSDYPPNFHSILRRNKIIGKE